MGIVYFLNLLFFSLKYHLPKGRRLQEVDEVDKSIQTTEQKYTHFGKES
jgi:hypothetical protein